MALFSEEYFFAHICPEYKEVLGLKRQVYEQIQCISSRISSVLCQSIWRKLYYSRPIQSHSLWSEYYIFHLWREICCAGVSANVSCQCHGKFVKTVLLRK